MEISQKTEIGNYEFACEITEDLWDDSVLPSQKTLLIVDDNYINRQILCKIFHNNYLCLEAQDGIEALEILREKGDSIALVILDIMMPRMDGYGFMEGMKNEPAFSHVPVIVTTQKSEEEDEIRALNAGASDFVTKPYKPQIIIKRVQNIIMLRETSAILNMVEKDKLTGLFGKEFFYQKIERILSKNPQRKYDIICCDIENFKLVNDMFGVKVGDKLLKFWAELFIKAVGKNGISGRLGADTFAAFVEHREDYSPEMFKAAGERVNKFPININLSLRFGIFSIDNEKIPVGVMCDRALLAADGTKGHYGEYFAYYNDSIRQRLLNEQFINDHMELALEEKQFLVYFQPKYSLKSDKIAGAEALVRWFHPQKGIMAPMEFIPLFERNGFITKLDYYVWDKTCELIRRWLDLGITVVPISVNVSRADIYNPNLLKDLSGLLEKYNLEPWRLHLEITETAYTENPKQIIEAAKKLKRYGFILEMDDFGSGYSSLNMLSELPIDVLKLDMKFIQNESKREGSRNILSFIVSLAKCMNLLVVAEGVETQAQIDHLKNIECHYVQGYYYASPMPCSKFEYLLQTEDLDCNDALSDEYPIITEAHVTENSDHEGFMLIVDDIEVHRYILKKAFSQSFTIVEAGSGHIGTKFIEENWQKIEIVLLDLAMPSMDGFQLLEKMKRDEKLRNIPVIITGQSGDNSEEIALDMGADDFISKPYNIKVIKNHVRRTIAYAKMRIKEKENEERLKVSTMAVYHDYLTGLLNRCGFDKAVENLHKEDNQGFFALYMIDLDDFKKYNDVHGHVHADDCLKIFGTFLKNFLRSNDIVARIGDDEFVVILKNVPSMEMAQKRGDTICSNWDSCHMGTCSVGFTVFHNDTDRDLKKVISEADSALYISKQSGKGKCCRFRIFA